MSTCCRAIPRSFIRRRVEGLLLFVLLWWFSAKQRPRGTVSALFLIGYGAGRWIGEYFREPDHGIFGQSYLVSMGQWLSLPMIVIGIFLFVRGMRNMTRPFKVLGIQQIAIGGPSKERLQDALGRQARPGSHRQLCLGARER